jgi:hypothetical protein
MMPKFNPDSDFISDDGKLHLLNLVPIEFLEFMNSDEKKQNLNLAKNEEKILNDFGIKIEDVEKKLNMVKDFQPHIVIMFGIFENITNELKLVNNVIDQVLSENGIFVFDNPVNENRTREVTEKLFEEIQTKSSHKVSGLLIEDSEKQPVTFITKTPQGSGFFQNELVESSKMSNALQMFLQDVYRKPQNVKTDNLI